MFRLAPEAATAITQITARPSVPDGAGLRIAVTGGRALTARIAGAPMPGDQVVHQHGARVFLDSAAAASLDGAALLVSVDDDGEARFRLVAADAPRGSSA